MNAAVIRVDDLCNYIRSVLDDSDSGLGSVNIHGYPQKPSLSIIGLLSEYAETYVSKKATYPNLMAFINEHHEEIYDFISGVERFNSQKVGNMRTFYRGMSDATYKLTAGLYRRTSSNSEKFYFNEIQVRCPEKLRMLDSLEKLVYMQHYGCPTRLLDITSNPLVALYFACVDNSDKDGVVYEFETSGNN
ncbi:MAG: FRG domain-containing protein, partial [Christensenellaceae bacterium]